MSHGQWSPPLGKVDIEKSSLGLKVNGVNFVKEHPSWGKQAQNENVLGCFAGVFYSFNSIHIVSPKVSNRSRVIKNSQYLSSSQ